MEDNYTLITAGIESLFLEVKGRRTHYFKAGSGPPIVLAHGGASDARDWLKIMSTLSGRFTLYAPDLPGFGESDRDKNGYYLSDFSKSLLEFINVLKISNPVLVGHSFGARVCLDVALLNPANVRKLVMIDASGLGKMSLMGSVLFFGFWALRELLHKKQPFPRFLSKKGDDYNRVDNKTLESVITPTLILWNSFDPHMPIRHAHKAQKLIPGARLAVIKGYGHAPQKQQDNSEFRRILLEFIDIP